MEGRTTYIRVFTFLGIYCNLIVVMINTLDTVQHLLDAQKARRHIV